MFKPPLYFIAGSLLALALTGCTVRFDPDAMQPRADVEAPPVYETHTVGQTFIATRPNLCAIEVVWREPSEVTGPFILHLRSDPLSTVDLAHVRIGLGDLTRGIGEAWLFLPAAALFWAPGFLLLQCWPAARRRFDAWEQMALALGLSLAVIPFLLLWITQLGGALHMATARMLFGGLGVAAVVVVGARLRHPVAQRAPRFTFSALPMALVLGVGLAVRLLAVRDLSLPAWVDSVHHSLVARIIAESGRVPISYEPYIAVQNAIYHYGFHASVAGFVWLSGKPLPQAMLFVGQVFNIAMALQVYLLARWLIRRRWAAFFAALIVALLSTMPAYYVSWGRYTQLSGLLILPVTSILTIEAAEQHDRRVTALGVLALAGLILTHYARLLELGWHVAIGLLALALLMPWIFQVADELWLRAFTRWGNRPPAAYRDFSWRYVTGGFDRYILTLGALGAVVALAERRRFSAVLLLWMGILFVVTNPSLLGLPGEGLINNVAMLIAWFMPLAIWCGFLGDELLSSWLAALKGRWRTVCYLLVFGALVALSVVGVHRQITIVNPDCVLQR